jgi:hypothetical protein
LAEKCGKGQGGAQYLAAPFSEAAVNMNRCRHTAFVS